MRARCLGLVVVAATTSCTTSLSNRASLVRWVSSPSEVAGCEFLGIVDGSSTQSGAANITYGRNNARNEALENAAKKGATHVHWLSGDESFGGVHYSAEAFDCSSRAAVAEEDEKPQRKAKRRAADEDEEETETPRSSPRKSSDETKTKEASGDRDERAADPGVSLGSCFFVSPDGIAVTNRHVVEGAKKIVVIDSSGAKLPATVLRVSPGADLVALDVPEATKHAFAPIDVGGNVSLGDSIFTIGFPYATYLGSDPKFADGAVSGLKGFGDDRLLQVTIPVQPGNSGGPVATDAGVVVGVIVAKLDALATLKTTGSLPENVNFAIKASELSPLLRGVSLGKTKRTSSRTEAVSSVREASCQVVAFLSDKQPQRSSPKPRHQGSDFDCETDGCPDGGKCEVKTGVCRDQ